MQFIENKSDYGVVKYRLPNVPETFELYGRMGVNPADFSDKKNIVNNGYYLTGKVISGMAFLIEEVKLNVDGREIKSHEDMIKEKKLLSVLCDIASRVIESLNGGSEEKKNQ